MELVTNYPLCPDLGNFADNAAALSIAVWHFREGRFQEAEFIAKELSNHLEATHDLKSRLQLAPFLQTLLTKLQENEEHA
jgi:hypothetical protein